MADAPRKRGAQICGILKAGPPITSAWWLLPSVHFSRKSLIICGQDDPVEIFLDAPLASRTASRRRPEGRPTSRPGVELEGVGVPRGFTPGLLNQVGAVPRALQSARGWVSWGTSPRPE